MPVWKAKGDGKNMYVLLYLLWILLNGRVTAEILAVGVPVAGLVYGFGYLALGYRLSGDLLLLKRLGHILVFLAMVAWEVVKANVAIIRIVLSPHMEITPCLVPVKTDLKSAGARAALANAITLTPGTITVDVGRDRGKDRGRDGGGRGAVYRYPDSVGYHTQHQYDILPAAGRTGTALFRPAHCHQYDRNQDCSHDCPAHKGVP